MKTDETPIAYEDRTAASNDKQVASPPYSLNLANLPAL